MKIENINDYCGDGNWQRRLFTNYFSHKSGGNNMWTVPIAIECSHNDSVSNFRGTINQWWWWWWWRWWWIWYLLTKRTAATAAAMMTMAMAAPKEAAFPKDVISVSTFPLVIYPPGGNMSWWWKWYSHHYKNMRESSTRPQSLQFRFSKLSSKTFAQITFSFCLPNPRYFEPASVRSLYKPQSSNGANSWKWRPEYKRCKCGNPCEKDEQCHKVKQMQPIWICI